MNPSLGSVLENCQLQQTDLNALLSFMIDVPLSERDRVLAALAAHALKGLSNG